MKSSRILCSTLFLLICFAPALNAAPEDGGTDSFLRATPEMKAFLAEHRITTRLAPLERMQRILDRLYGIGDGFGYAAKDNFTAEEAFRMRRGNCISFAMLFVTLAREVGLQAEFNQVDYSPVWEEIDGILVETTHINAIVFVSGSQYVVEGMPEYSEIASRSRNPVSDERVISHYFNNSGLLALTRGEVDLAQDLINKAIAIDPTNSAAWQNLGLHRFRSGDNHGGEEALIAASQNSEYSSSSCFLLSQYYEKMGDAGKAERYAKMGAKRSKRNPFFHYNRSRQALAEGDLKKAIKYLEKAMKLLPHYSTFQIELARLKESEARDHTVALR